MWQDPVIRAGRTAAQAFLAFVIGSGVLTVFAAEGSVTATLVEQVLIGAGFAALAAVVSFAQNWLEESNDIVVGRK